jgi:DNA-binding transcriptional regulator YiaG
MPNINSVLNQQIRRLARREIRANTKPIKKATAHYRRDIAALKRQVAQLLKLVGTLQTQMPALSPTPPAQVVEKARLRIDGLKSHRARLGLSAKDYGKLMGVSGLTIYHWEAGKSKPRRSQLAKIVAVRGIGKREALRRLGMTPETPAAPRAARKALTKRRSRRVNNKHTAEQMILRMLKGHKGVTRSAINAEWKKEGRAGTANLTLGKMVKSRRLKRLKAKGKRGN